MSDGQRSGATTVTTTQLHLHLYNNGRRHEIGDTMSKVTTLQSTHELHDNGQWQCDTIEQSARELHGNGRQQHDITTMQVCYIVSATIHDVATHDVASSHYDDTKTRNINRQHCATMQRWRAPPLKFLFFFTR
jgi:hypothetical protein